MGVPDDPWICPECQKKEVRNTQRLVFPEKGAPGQGLTWRRAISQRKIVFLCAVFLRKLAQFLKRKGDRQEKGGTIFALE